jgi:hypothetical protein
VLQAFVRADPCHLLVPSHACRPRAGRSLCSPRTPTHPGPRAAALRAFWCRSPPGPPPRMDRSSTNSPHCTRRLSNAAGRPNGLGLGMRSAVFAIISSTVISNPIPMSTAPLASLLKEPASLPMGLEQYYPQVPGRERSFEAAATALAGLLAPIRLQRNPVRSWRDWEIGHRHKMIGKAPSWCRQEQKMRQLGSWIAPLSDAAKERACWPNRSARVKHAGLEDPAEAYELLGTGVLPGAWPRCRRSLDCSPPAGGERCDGCTLFCWSLPSSNAP